MARLEDKIAEIADGQLRQAITEEVAQLKKRTRFGLVYEEHQPEVVPVHEARIKRGERVAIRTGSLTDIWRVLSVRDGLARCEKDKDAAVRESFPLEQLIVVRRMGEAIYPALTPIDAVSNGDPSQPHHILIEADNYHALQLMLFPYEGKIDCIYIDPPYNTGARDWKYNNNFVDDVDAWKHSKWLTFMSRRLRIAKRLLRPDTGVLIVTIDEHEVHHLGCLLEQEFPDFYRQMVTIVINPKGVTQGRFARVEEYALFCFQKDAYISGVQDDLLTKNIIATKKPRWKGLLRSGTDARRRDRESMFFPIAVDPMHKRVVKAGYALPLGQKPDFDMLIDGFPVAWPIRNDGSYGRWSVGRDTLEDLISKGYTALGKYDEKRRTFGLSYLSQEICRQIDENKILVISKDEVKNTVEVEYAETKTRSTKTVWHRTKHDAGAYGSDLLTTILGHEVKFSFPKSLYSTFDAVSSIVRDNPKALILDFFAGSGTTLNAINLLNSNDGGQRQCILVTNN